MNKSAQPRHPPQVQTFVHTAQGKAFGACWWSGNLPSYECAKTFNAGVEPNYLGER